MRESVIQFTSLGRLPEEETAEVAQLQEFESALNAIERPVSKQEAVELLCSFPTGEHSCFGLAWSLLHLIETAPDWPYREARLHGANPWVKTMLERAA